MEEITLSLDLGSSNFKFSLVSSKRGQLYSSEYTFETRYGDNGAVEIEPEKLWESISKRTEATLNSFAREDYPTCLSISTQRESVLLWCAQTGESISPIFSWQDTRTDYLVDELSLAQRNLIREKTGLWVSSYCSAPKLSYLINSYSQSTQSPFLWGTLESWLIFKFTQGMQYVSDLSSAARTGLLNLETLEWDPALFEIFKLPFAIKPKLISNNQTVGRARIGNHYLIIKGVIGDQQAALHAASKLGIAPFSLVYGTGAFALFLLPEELEFREIIKRYGVTRHLTITLAWKLENEEPRFALELGFSNSYQPLEWLLEKANVTISDCEDQDYVDFVLSESKPLCYPFFTKKWFLTEARIYSASFTDICFTTSPNDVFLACLEGLAYSIRKGLELMNLNVISRVAVGGGLVNNSLFLKSQSNFLETELVRVSHYQLSGVGAALLVFRGVEFKPPLEEVRPERAHISLIESRYQRWTSKLIQIYS
ncbi:FGGY family carbohydrate kinase [Candidatus Mycoplasma haematominutum]|uniref:Glycerol kinase n=1 Tax=Candidatus Mycoplasma haematominutum 'Birmingham 1' TaxID=1116213 RepID=G8C2N5_9MOLU|nr:FGGY family carbohydrate kinase [Candidatus Mycoplasma haematominutum]CCE66583.1 glycerol kinase [Candidatus Mycoplasma haematominutum 'Birmingham 1']